LLLIRVVAGGALILQGLQGFQVGPEIGNVLFGIAAVADGALLLAGLWTPVAGCVAIAVVVWQVVAGHNHPYPGILLAAMGGALALVGPGAISLDAWLFGWKRIDV
jgi:uncharacterized membrane protein YphA (DoxX/SURF4 family)